MTMSEEGSSGIRLNPRRALGLAGRVPVRVRVVLYTNTPRIVDTIRRHPLKIFDNLMSHDLRSRGLMRLKAHGPMPKYKWQILCSTNDTRRGCSMIRTDRCRWADWIYQFRRPAEAKLIAPRDNLKMMSANYIRTAGSANVRYAQ